MKLAKLLVLPIITLLASPQLLTAAGSSPAFTISPDAARLLSLSPGGKDIGLSGNGGFNIYDATAGRNVTLPAGLQSGTTGGITFQTESRDVRLKAVFTSQGDRILVTGEIENLRHDDRGFLLDYRIPVQAVNPVFSNDLVQQLSVAGETSYEGNAFPVAALCGGGTGVAVAIPPSAPRVFGMIGSGKGLAVRFYLGTTPVTRKFPNAASFSFIIYAADPSAGFRSALSQYYRFYPDYYTPRLKKDGLYMFQMGGRTPANAGDYGFDLLETQLPTVEQAIARDQKYNITTWPYMIVGQREIKFLPALPATYEEAMAVYDKWTVADLSGHPLTKENACSQGDIHLKQEVGNSAVKNADGKYCIVIRNTLWGGNSITFKMNPNPDLFRDQHRPTVGSYALELTDQWLREHPQFGGMFVDSLGANWPAVLNYREDHFPYARYPLTVDPNGRVALDNAISHYEYLEALRAKMRGSGRILSANGVYAYVPKGTAAKAIEKQTIDTRKNEFIALSSPPQHYRTGVKLSRFFCAALLDVASCEFGVKATVEQCQDIRVLMGPKQFALLNYSWDDPVKVGEFVNKSLCYGIFASTSTNFFTGEEYESNPKGYLRDKPLLDWYVPLVRLLSRAGWEPATHAAVSNPAVFCERFGKGAQVYFTLYNDSGSKQQCTLSIDLKALGLAENGATVTEVARKAALTRQKPDVLSLTLEPKTTVIIAVAGNTVSDGRAASAF